MLWENKKLYDVVLSYNLRRFRFTYSDLLRTESHTGV